MTTGSNPYGAAIPGSHATRNAQSALTEVSEMAAAVAARSNNSWRASGLSSALVIFVVTVMPWLVSPGFSLVFVLLIFGNMVLRGFKEHRQGFWPRLPLSDRSQRLGVVCLVSVVAIFLVVQWLASQGQPLWVGLIVGAANALLVAVAFWQLEMDLRGYQLCGPLPKVGKSVPQLDPAFGSPARMRIGGVLVNVQVVELSELVRFVDRGDAGLSEDVNALTEAGYAMVFWRNSRFPNLGRRLWVKFTPAGRNAFKGQIAALQRA